MARSAGTKPPARRASPPPPSVAAQSPAPAPAGVAVKNTKPQATKSKRKNDYGSEGVEDNDVFLLPGADYQTLIVVTIVSALVRLFRIYQPTSVVFDEVQYGIPLFFLWSFLSP